tara:strand:- start:31 stop:159 length:129 start_codon:yes stop_codon:yes gene_type:complete
MYGDLEVLEEVFVVIPHPTEAPKADVTDRMNPDLRRLRGHKI